MHVLVPPAVDGRALATLGIPAPVLEATAEGVAETARRFAALNASLHPAWMAEGARRAIAQRVLAERGRCAPGGGVALDKAWVRAAALRDQDGLPSVRDLLAGRLDEVPLDDRSRLHLALFAFLEQSRTRTGLGKIVAFAVSQDAGADFGDRVLAEAERALGDLDKLDGRFRKAVDEAEPAWDQRQPALWTTTDGRLAQQDVDGRGALAWWAEAPGDGGYAVEGRLALVPGAGSEVSVLVARSGRRHVAVTLDPATGVVVRDARSSLRTTELGRADGERVVPDGGLPFSVSLVAPKRGPARGRRAPGEAGGAAGRAPRGRRPGPGRVVGRGHGARARRPCGPTCARAAPAAEEGSDRRTTGPARVGGHALVSCGSRASSNMPWFRAWKPARVTNWNL